MVITGDLEQSDRIENNGLKDLITKYKNINDQKNIRLIELDKADIQRSDLVNKVIHMYNFKPPIIQPNIIQPKIKKEVNNTKSYTIDTTQNGDNDAALIPKKDMLRIISIIPPLKK
jgi:hypothetical protein